MSDKCVEEQLVIKIPSLLYIKMMIITRNI